MKYFIGKTVQRDFYTAVDDARTALKAEGFGIITEINMSATLKNKIGKDIPDYLILGACNPDYAYHAVSEEPNVGVMLPCNVIVRQLEGDKVEVAAIDPIASMMAIENPKLHGFASEVKEKLVRAIDAV
jgi:uncharacterized protein (DUF302 family)